MTDLNKAVLWRTTACLSNLAEVLATSRNEAPFPNSSARSIAFSMAFKASAWLLEALA